MRYQYIPAGAILTDVIWHYAGATWGVLLLALISLWAASSSSHASAKSVTTEQRVNTLVGTVGAHNSRITTVENGSMPGIGVTVSGYGATLQANVLSGWNDSGKVSYLNGLRQVSDPGGVPAAPSGYTQSWGQGMTGVLNTMIAYLGQHGVWP